jgi:hypothetical protein
MSKLRKFLSFYSIVLTAVFAVGSPFFFPRPYSLLLTLLLIPMVIYFWIGLSNPLDVGVGKWSIRLVLIIFIFTILGIFCFWLSRNQACSFNTSPKTDVLSEISESKITPSLNIPESSDSANLARDLKDIKGEITEIKAMLESKNYSLGINDFDDNLTIGELTLTNNQKRVDVYESAKTTAKIIGELLPENNYYFYKKEGEWYQVEYSTNHTGWVKAELVKEVK